MISKKMKEVYTADELAQIERVKPTYQRLYRESMECEEMSKKMHDLIWFFREDHILQKLFKYDDLYVKDGFSSAEIWELNKIDPLFKNTSRWEDDLQT